MSPNDASWRRLNCFSVGLAAPSWRANPGGSVGSGSTLSLRNRVGERLGVSLLPDERRQLVRQHIHRVEVVEGDAEPDERRGRFNIAVPCFLARHAPVAARQSCTAATSRRNAGCSRGSCLMAPIVALPLRAAARRRSQPTAPSPLAAPRRVRGARWHNRIHLPAPRATRSASSSPLDRATRLAGAPGPAPMLAHRAPAPTPRPASK